MDLGAVAPLAVRRYSEEQTRTQQGRLQRGSPLFLPSGVSGPDFGAYLGSLLPPEQTMPFVARALTSRAAEALAQQPAASLRAAEALPETPLATPTAPPAAEAKVGPALPSAEWTVPPSAGQLLGLLQRVLGVPVDAGLAAGIRLAGGEPLDARPIRSAPLRLLRQATVAYGR